MSNRIRGPHASNNLGPPSVTQITPAFALAVFQRWWMALLPIGLILAAAVSTFFILQFEPQYRATAILSIAQPPHIAFKGGGVQTGRYVQTQLAIMKSAIVHAPLLENTEIANLPELLRSKNPVNSLAARLSVANVGRSDLYNLSYTSTSPRGAALVCEELVRTYMQQNTEYDIRKFNLMINTLQTEKVRRSTELNRQRRDLMEKAKDMSGTNPFTGQITDAETVFKVSPLAALHRELTGIEWETLLLDTEIKAREDMSLDVATEGRELLDIQIDADPAVRKTLAAIDALNRQAQFADYFTGQDHPSRLRLVHVLGQRQEELAEDRIAAEERILRDRDLTRAAKLKDLRRQLSGLDRRRQEVQKQYAEAEKQLRTSEVQNIDFMIAQSELKRAQSVFNLIASRELALRVEQARPALVKLMRPAEVPSLPITKAPYRNMLVFGVGAMVAPYGLFFLFEFMRRRIYNAEQIRTETGVAVVGEVARLPRVKVHRDADGEVMQSRGMGVYLESIDTLQTSLLLSGSFRKSSVLGVTSSVAEEGKTSVAVQLALSVARATKEPTLLIDADLRAPDVTKQLSLDNDAPGLSEILLRECAAADAVQDAEFESLSVIGAGRPVRHAHDLLRTDQFEALLNQLREEYSFIIVDTAPVLGASESLATCKLCDGVLFCCMCDSSIAAQAKLAIARMQHAGVKLSGAVLNGIPMTRYSYSYGKYYEHRSERAHAETS